MSATLELTRDLMTRRSVTPADEGCQEVMTRRLQAIGFDVEPLRFGSVDNFWATHGREDGPVFCFAGHTDVVPTGPLEEWRSDPFVPAVRDGILYGRGAADMKSGLAAMITATEEFLAAHPAHRGRSPSSSPATRKVLRSTAPSASSRLCARGRAHRLVRGGRALERGSIGDTIKVGRRGSLSARLTVHGVQGHVAYPRLADNPVHRFAPALAELATRVWDQGTEHFQPTSFQVSNLNAGTGAPNVIPGSSRRASTCATRRCRPSKG